MSPPLAALAPDLVIGVSCLLAIGSLAVAALRAPIHRQRVAEAALLAAAIWSMLAFVPMPKWIPTGTLSVEAGAAPSAGIERRTLEPGSAAGARLGARALEATQREARPLAPATPATSRGPLAPLRDRPLGLSDEAAARLRASDSTGAGSDSFDGAASDVSIGVVGDVGVERTGDGARRLAAASAERLSWTRAAWSVYLTGVLLGLVWLGVGAGRLVLTLRRSEPAPAWLRAEADGSSARLRVTSRAGSPFCFGFLRPTVVLPDTLLLAEHDATRRQVLAHELAHAEQGDGFGRVLFALALPFLWCHPCFWWLRRRHHLSAELVADDRAAARTDKRAYARELVALAESALVARTTPSLTLPILGLPSDFYTRIDMLLHRNHRLASTCGRTGRVTLSTLTLLLPVLLSGVWGAAPAPAQSADPFGGAATRPAGASGLGHDHPDAAAARTRDARDASPFAVQDPQAHDTSQEMERLRKENAMLKKKLREIESRLGGRGGDSSGPQALDDPGAGAAPLGKIEFQEVTVRAGDSLHLLLERHGLPEADLVTIAKMNGLESADRLAVGQRLYLPTGRVITERGRIPMAGGGYGDGQGGAPGAGSSPLATDAHPGADAAPSHRSRLTGMHPRAQNDAIGLGGGGAGGAFGSSGGGRNTAGLPAGETAPSAGGPDPFGAGPAPGLYGPSAGSELAMDAELLELVMQTLDLEASLSLAYTELEQTAKLAEGEYISESELHAAKLKLETSERKLQILRRLLEAELLAARATMDGVRARLKRGSLEESEAKAILVRLDARIDTLSEAL